MKKVLLTFALALSMSVPAFAATTITQWEGVQSADPAYAGTQDGAAAGDSANGIIWTRHNLSSYGEHYQASASNQLAGYTSGNVETTEVCVFCHTPHHGLTTSAPLWNKATTATYTAYGTTVAGTASDANVGGSSLACLSCHDGVTTLDSMINKPGKGSNTTGTGSAAGYAFIDKAGTLVVGGADSPTINSGRLNIGTTTANDHPVSIVYTPTAASLRPTATVISSITMDQAQTFGGAAIYGRSDNLWSVKGFISDTATISDLLRDGGKVQCASCHDPHYKNQTNNDPAVVASYGAGVPQNGVDHDGLFLRRVGGNSNSGVCRTCHNK